MTIQILSLRKKDLDKIIEIENESFVNSWTINDYINEMTHNPFAYYLKLIDKDSQEIMRFVGFYIMFEHAEISKIAIAKKYRGYKLSKLLLTDVIKRISLANCENITLEVRVSNIVAINLYQKLGFEIINTRKKYYPDGEDAYLMNKNLREED